MKAGLALALLAIISGSIDAVCAGAATSDDPHAEVVDFAEGRPISVRGALGYQLMIALAPDEQVRSIALGDGNAWQVNVDKEGGRLFLKPLRAGDPTNMTVVTSVRTYSFNLEAGTALEPDTPYSVAFRYSPSSPAIADDIGYVDVASVSRRLSKYRISGDRALQPDSVSNDGQHTYISWASTASIPAIYSIDSSGKEVLVNGRMGTDDVFVVDGVPQILVFRIDRSLARAERISPRRIR